MIVWIHFDISEVGWGNAKERRPVEVVIYRASNFRGGKVESSGCRSRDDGDGPISPALRVSKLRFQTDQETNSY